jgi:hypothetical protein
MWDGKLVAARGMGAVARDVNTVVLAMGLRDGPHQRGSRHRNLDQPVKRAVELFVIVPAAVRRTRAGCESTTRTQGYTHITTMTLTAPLSAHHALNLPSAMNRSQFLACRRHEARRHCIAWVGRLQGIVHRVRHLNVLKQLCGGHSHAGGQQVAGAPYPWRNPSVGKINRTQNPLRKLLAHTAHTHLPIHRTPCAYLGAPDKVREYVQQAADQRAVAGHNRPG